MIHRRRARRGADDLVGAELGDRRVVEAQQVAQDDLGVLAGATGWLTAGNRHAADDVFSLVDGTQVMTPAIIEDRERFTWGDDEY